MGIPAEQRRREPVITGGGEGHDLEVFLADPPDRAEVSGRPDHDDGREAGRGNKSAAVLLDTW